MGIPVVSKTLYCIFYTLYQSICRIISGHQDKSERCLSHNDICIAGVKTTGYLNILSRCLGRVIFTRHSFSVTINTE